MIGAAAVGFQHQPGNEHIRRRPDGFIVRHVETLWVAYDN
jgi:hypothetical protein